MIFVFDVGFYWYYSDGEFDLGLRFEFVVVFVEIFDVVFGRDEVGVFVMEMEVWEGSKLFRIDKLWILFMLVLWVKCVVEI